MTRGTATPAPPATVKQLDLIYKLLDERQYAGDVPDLDAINVREASKLIDALFASPRVRPNADRAINDGIYETPDGRIFKVYRAVHGSGRYCVKVLNTTDGAFEYLGLAALRLPADATPMSLERAKSLGTVYGICIRCGATLTDEASIRAGIGPVCGGAW